MEEMKNFECAICGKIYNKLQERLNCETECLKSQEEIEKASKEAAKNKEVERINGKIEELIKNFINILEDIDNFYETFGEDEEIEDESINNFISDIINYIF